MKQFVLPLAIIASFVIGLACGYSYWGKYWNDARYIHFIRIEGVYLNGKYWVLEKSDIKRIEESIKHITEGRESVRQIHVISSKKVSVTTSEKEESLGGGVYILEQKDSGWSLIDKWGWVAQRKRLTSSQTQRG